MKASTNGITLLIQNLANKQLRPARQYIWSTLHVQTKLGAGIGLVNYVTDYRTESTPTAGVKGSNGCSATEHKQNIQYMKKVAVG